MIAWLISRRLPFLLAMTKADKISRSKRGQQEALIRTSLNLQVEVPFVFFSSETGEGKDELRAWVDSALEAGRKKMLR
jgi:GTP-binding protein